MKKSNILIFSVLALCGVGIGAKMNDATKKFDVYNAQEQLIGSTQVLTTEEILMLAKI